MNKRKIKLVLNQGPIDLIAISCSESIQRVGWLLNSHLDILLKEADPLKIVSSKKLEANDDNHIEFPIYKDEASHPELTYLLIKNRIETHLLYKELQNIDYLFAVKGADRENQQNNFVQKIKKIPGVLAAIPIKSERLTNISAILNAY